jgi:hypothetical protein
MKTIIILLTVLLVLGYFFVQWANKPENVAALLQERKEKASKKIADEKQKAIRTKQLAAKVATMSLTIDENFAHQKFDYLSYNTNDGRFIKFKDGMAVYSDLITKGQSASDYFVFSKEDYQDFVAEVTYEIWGSGAFCGIVYDAKLNEKGYAVAHQAAYAGIGYLYLRTDGLDNFRIGGFMESINKQVLRVEKIGTHLKAQVNGKVLFDADVTTHTHGKVGLFLSHGGGGEYPASIIVNIKSFRVWQ